MKEIKIDFETYERELDQRSDLGQIIGRMQTLKLLCEFFESGTTLKKIIAADINPVFVGDNFSMIWEEFSAALEAYVQKEKKDEEVEE